MSAEEAERAFVTRFQARWGAVAALITTSSGAQGGRQGSGGGARSEEDEIERLLPRITGVGRRKKRATAVPLPFEGRSLARSPDVLRRCLWAVVRRFTGRLLIRGRLLNMEELLVTHLKRDDQKSGSQRSIRVPGNTVRLAMRCVGGSAAQVGQGGVLARVVDPRDVDALLLMADDATGDVAPLLRSTQPVAVVSASADSEEAWSDPQPLEEMDAVYGFDVDAFASSGWNVAADHSDDDEQQALSALLTSSRLFQDLRGTDKLMELFQIPSDSFLSFATSKYRQQARSGAADGLEVSSESDPWSYRELDSAQKRKWADERYEYGLELVAKRKLREAAAEFESALKLNDRHARALAAKGRAHAALHQLQDAVDCLERAVDIDPLLNGAHDDLLRTKGTLAHSRHVSSDARYDLSKPRSELISREEEAVPRGRSPQRRADGRNQSSKRSSVEAGPSTAASIDSAKSLEEERLRALLEEEERRRKQSRPSRRRRLSESDESDSSDGRGRSRERRKSSSKKRKREKKHKKEKRRHKKSERHRKSRKSGRKDGDRYESDYSSSDSRGSKASDMSRRRSPRHRSKSRVDEGNGIGDLPAILSRTKHRIWN